MTEPAGGFETGRAEAADGAASLLTLQRELLWMWLAFWPLPAAAIWLTEQEDRADRLEALFDLSRQANVAMAEAGRVALHAADRMVASNKTMLGRALEAGLQARRASL